MESEESQARVQAPDRATLAARHERLQVARAALKAHFVGIDRVIDQLVDAIRVWYVMPEVLTRPVIVNLWGMTGVGKTDLVRRLVRILDFQRRFAEIELHVAASKYFATSVASVLESHDLTDGRPAILLFDEVQRFATIDKKGKPIRTSNFIDFWELLSDGQLARRRRADLDYQAADMILEINERRQEKAKGSDEDEDEPIGAWSAQRLKRALGLTTSLEELAMTSQEEAVEIIRSAQAKRKVYEPIDQSQTLVIISGNLDDAFSMATDTTEADVDADVFHAFASKVSVIDVKSALTKRFLPEQVARFGNVHILSSSLTRRDFEALIARELERVCGTLRERCGLELAIDSSIHELVYRNGVFPTQGVRPVFSSVADIVENNLARFTYEALTRDFSSIALRYDRDGEKLVARLTGPAGLDDIEHRYVGRLDAIRQRKLDDTLANVAVHEAGHALLYALEFGLAPLQLTARTASTSTAGFTFSHDFDATKAALRSRIRVLLAGGLAEELIFGEELATTGRRDDRRRATVLALDYVRAFAFEPGFEAFYGLEDEHEMDMRPTDAPVEALLARCAQETRTRLEEQRPLLVELAKRLRALGRLDAEAVAACAREHGVEARVEPEGYRHSPPFSELLGDA